MVRSLNRRGDVSICIHKTKRFILIRTVIISIQFYIHCHFMPPTQNGRFYTVFIVNLRSCIRCYYIIYPNPHPTDEMTVKVNKRKGFNCSPKTDDIFYSKRETRNGCSEKDCFRNQRGRKNKLKNLGLRANQFEYISKNVCIMYMCLLLLLYGETNVFRIKLHTIAKQLSIMNLGAWCLIPDWILYFIFILNFHFHLCVVCMVCNYVDLSLSQLRKCSSAMANNKLCVQK